MVFEWNQDVLEFNTLSNRAIQELGEPDLSIAGWKLWVVGRYGDGWISAWSVCEATGARVKTDGSIVFEAGVATFIEQLKDVWKQCSGKATLDNLEPNLSAEISLNERGRGELIVRITPDIDNQKHEFRFNIDQSYLPDFIRSLEKILEYPVNKSHLP